MNIEGTGQGTAAEPFAQRSGRWLATPGGKALLIVALLAAMAVPHGLIAGLIEDRMGRQNEVLSEFRQNWGGPLLVAPPFLAVPYVRHPGNSPETLYLSPSAVTVRAELSPQVQRRGLFHATVFTAHLQTEGVFRVARDALPGEPDAVILWAKSVVVFPSSPAASIDAAPVVKWDDHPLVGTATDTDLRCLSFGKPLIGRALAGQPGDASIAFSISSTLRGSDQIRFLPLGTSADISARGRWASPGFSGERLPTTSSIDGDGFEATWRFPSESGEAPAWSATLPGCDNALTERGHGAAVTLGEAVPTYRLVDRAGKYWLLFTALAFLTYFLFETVVRLRIHLVQYGLLGLSMSLFALLLIAISEPLGFAAGYALSSAAIVAQSSLYTLAVVRGWRHALTFAGVLATLFGFLFVVLSLESFALLAGAVLLFATLSVVMAVTRRVEWGAP
jgi:inner membrane protein